MHNGDDVSGGSGYIGMVLFKVVESRRGKTLRRRRVRDNNQEKDGSWGINLLTR